METIDPRRLLAAVAKILNDLDIPYMVTGGMAVFVWGQPRFTADIDIVIELQEKNIPALAKALQSIEEAGYIDEEAVRNALRNKGEFNFVSPSTGLKVDFWVLGRDPFDKTRLTRRVAKEIINQTVYFIAPEDLILTKLRWYQESGSSKHLEDAQSILQKMRKGLDKNYLREWAEKQGTSEILLKLLS